MKKSLSFLALLLLLADMTVAHEGPRIWIGNTAGSATTFTSDNDVDPSLFSPSRVFDTDLSEFFGIYSTEFPGYEVMPTSSANVSPGTIFGFQLAGPLLRFDATNGRLRPAGQLQSGPAPTMGVVTVSQSRFTNTGVQPGFDFFQYNTNGDHAHMSYVLYGDGTSPGGGVDGVYAVPFRLTSNRLATSAWYILLLTKNTAGEELTHSREYAERMVGSTPGDANFDGSVNLDDFTTLAANFGALQKWWGDGDFNFDGAVNLDDFTALAANFGATVPRPAAVPEPAMVGVLAGGLLVRRRNRGR